MQDSAPSHHAKVTHHFLQQNTLDFIAADELVPYSPDLNSLDYCIWDTLQDLVYTKADDFRLPIYRISKRQPKTNRRRSPFRQFENPLHNGTRGQSNLTKSASRGAHSPVRGHPRGSKVVPLNSWGRVSY